MWISTSERQKPHRRMGLLNVLGKNWVPTHRPEVENLHPSVGCAGKIGGRGLRQPGPHWGADGDGGSRRATRAWSAPFGPTLTRSPREARRYDLLLARRDVSHARDAQREAEAQPRRPGLLWYMDKEGFPIDGSGALFPSGWV